MSYEPLETNDDISCVLRILTKERHQDAAPGFEDEGKNMQLLVICLAFERRTVLKRVRSLADRRYAA